MSKTEQERSILGQGLLLASAGILTKIIGFLYRIPMANILGEEGNGIYSVAFGIYNVALTLSSYSLPLAVSKLLSARYARGERQNAQRIFRLSQIFAAVTGTLAFLALFFGAGALEGIYNCPGLSRPLRVLSVTTYVVAFLGVFRGYFQGHSDMGPTAISQIIEQIVNAVVSVAAAWGLAEFAVSGFYGDSPASSLRASFAAAGGTFGTLSGALAALVTLVLLYLHWRRKRFGSFREHKDTVMPSGESALQLLILLIATVLPVIISQTIYQIGYTVDDLVFGRLTALKGIPSETATALRGVFNTQYNQLINLPVAVSTAMAASALPGIVRAVAREGKEEGFRRASEVLSFNMAFAFPAAVGLAVLSDPIMGILFPRLVNYHDLAARLLLTGSSAVVFYALSTLTTSILQAYDHMKIPVIHAGISLVIHVILISVLLYMTDLGVYALIIGNVTFPFCVCSMNLLKLKKLGFQPDLSRLLLKPVLASVLMGVAAHFAYVLLSGIPLPLFQSFRGLVPTGISILLSALLYAALAQWLGIIKVKDVLKRIRRR